jgi:tetratricopeptide (TPR) repeat protein
MSFDKVKAMRNAERFLAQGKLRAAISEYKRVIESDKTDYNTLNMLGDLYVKASEPDEAVNCFTQVAEHYGKQGFAQKAIAIYNKISRLKPDSIEVTAKLAQLYQAKGSFAEARTHYTTVAEQYTKSGKKAEALGIWKQIANLDPNNTDIFLKIADACWQDEQKEEAANAYIEAGNRLTNKSQYESAITAFSRALEIRPDDLPALRGYVKSQLGLGYADEAASALESSIVRQPHSREIINLLADCYIEAGKLAEAEKTIVKLVEKEPTNYPKLLEIFQAYVKARDIPAATRMLTMASEHLLVGGRAIELEEKITEVLEFNPDDLNGIRLLVRFHSWQRDEAGIKTAFERLAEAAKQNDAVEDEMHALSQLVMISPQNVYFAQRLQELNLANGGGYYQNPSATGNGDVPTFESYTVLNDEDVSVAEEESEFVQSEETELPQNLDEFRQEADEFQAVEEVPTADGEVEQVEDYRKLSEYERHGLQSEIEGIDFYLEQGFYDLADKTLVEMEEHYGNQPEIKGLRAALREKTGLSDFEPAAEQFAEAEEKPEVEMTEEISAEAEPDESFESVESESLETIDSTEATIADDEDIESVKNESVTDESTIEESETVSEPMAEIEEEFAESVTDFENNEEVAEETVAEFTAPQLNPFDELKSELSAIENSPTESAEDVPFDDNFETSYQTGIVYREMGLIEDSIREFQDAIKLVKPQDGTRRFFLCCNMLGLCFMEKQMPTIAIMWFKQGLDASHLSEFELNGMRYELANAYEKCNDKQKAQQLFEEIYAVDVSFRDVGARLQNLLTP